MKKIILDADTKKTIMKMFGVSASNVAQALNFRRHSDNAKRMRMYALSHGGELLESKTN